MMSCECPDPSHDFTAQWRAEGFSYCHKSTILRAVKVDLNPEMVAARIDRWLRIERWTTYNGGHNNILDNYTKNREMYLPNAEGEYSNKVLGHYVRFERLMALMSPEHEFQLGVPYADDKYVARIGHHGLMFASGAYRWWSNAQAKDSWSYNRIHIGPLPGLVPPSRHRSPVSIDLVTSVKHGLATAQSFAPGKEISQIRDYGNTINSDIYSSFGKAQEAIAESNALPGVALRLDHTFLNEMDNVQRDAIAFVAAHFAVATEVQGSKELVPIFQPDSITKVADMPLLRILADTPPRYTVTQPVG